MKKLRRRIITILLIVLLVIVLLIGYGAIASRTSTWEFTAVYRRPDGTTYTLSGTGRGPYPQCPPFQNGGHDVMVNCLMIDGQ